MMVLRMSNKIKLKLSLVAVAVGWLATLTGCSLGEATLDGVFGGVSDTIAGIISGVLFDLLGVLG